jgi:hypothetical protein
VTSAEIKALQEGISRQADGFSPEEISDLQVIIRVALEASVGLVADDLPEKLHSNQYHLETAISGIDCFPSVLRALKVLGVARDVPVPVFSAEAIESNIAGARESFLNAKEFDTQCQALIMLYRLLLIAYALSYEG